jgi:L-threonylcarbamoyladenylate synthase
LELSPQDSIGRRAASLVAKGLRVAVIGWSDQQVPPIYGENEKAVYFSMPAEPEGYGRQLYAALRQLDQQRFDYLLVETPPDETAWMAIRDRLQRASCISDFKFQLNDDDPARGARNAASETTHG